MRYLLDTNTCIYLLNGNQMLEDKVRKIGVYSLSLSNCILAELYFGAYNSKKVKANLQRIEQFKKYLTILSGSEDSARIFGKIKVDLKEQGKIIDDFDLLIASIALSNDCILVTNNTNHFDRIEGLHIEDWLK